VSWHGPEYVRYFVVCTLVSGVSSFSLVVVCVWQDVVCSRFVSVAMVLRMAWISLRWVFWSGGEFLCLVLRLGPNFWETVPDHCFFMGFPFTHFGGSHVQNLREKESVLLGFCCICECACICVSEKVEHARQLRLDAPRCCSSVVQCPAVWCRVLQGVAVCRSVLQCVAVWCSVCSAFALCCRSGSSVWPIAVSFFPCVRFKLLLS